MKKIDSIEIIFENCESIRIPRDSIFYMAFNDITRGMMWSKHNGEIEYQNANEIVVVLNPEADVEYAPFDIEDLKSTVFSRIGLHDDITSIGINYEDDETEFISAYWDDSDEYGVNNKCQKTYMLDDKLRIEIRRN